jgi:hypothetical protein
VTYRHDVSRHHTVPPAGIEPATRGLGNGVSTDMTVDRGTFPLVDALEVPRSTWARRCCYQTGANSAHELHAVGVAGVHQRLEIAVSSVEGSASTSYSG